MKTSIAAIAVVVTIPTLGFAQFPTTAQGFIGGDGVMGMEFSFSGPVGDSYIRVMEFKTTNGRFELIDDPPAPFRAILRAEDSYVAFLSLEPTTFPETWITNIRFHGHPDPRDPIASFNQEFDVTEVNFVLPEPGFGVVQVCLLILSLSWVARSRDQAR